MHIYLETAPQSGRFNHRGEAGPCDDLGSYRRMMAKSGLRVITDNDYQGARIDRREADAAFEAEALAPDAAPEADAPGEDNPRGD